MFSFRVIARSKRSRARVGILKTSHGDVETPAFVPVATQAAVKALDVGRVLGTKTNILIANTYHLHLRPGEAVVKNLGGLHSFMGWRKPLMTDSGGFQVFSLGFGKELETSKISGRRKAREIEGSAQPKLLKITDDGVVFRSHIDGKKLFLGPAESMNIQKALGADIVFAFDECPPPSASREYMLRSLEKTHRWARQSLKAHDPVQALYGIVQGGRFKDLRVRSARFIRSLPFEGFGIGGEFGASKRTMAGMLRTVADELPEEKPRHLLGIGYPEDIGTAVRAGMDTFDCIAPTHYARRGVAYTSRGAVDMTKRAFEKDKKSLDLSCPCFVCTTHTRAYIHHLFRAREIAALELVSFHNLYAFNTELERMRQRIKDGEL